MKEIIEKSLQRLSFQYRLFRYSLPYQQHHLKCRFLELRHQDFLSKIQKADISPIFIVGAGRSGNTLLARLLHETGGVHFGPENYTLFQTYLNYLKCINEPWQQRINRILDILAGQADNWRWEKVDKRAVRQQLLQSNEQTLGNIIHCWYSYYGNAIEYPSERWGCKTPNLTPYIIFFMFTFPKLKVIHIIRNPSEVISSFSKTNIAPYNDDKMAAVHWDYFNHSLNKVEINKYVVSYDELVDQTSTTVGNLCSWLDIRNNSYVTFENPDLKYSHLTNVNTQVYRKKHVFSRNFEYERLKNKYAIYIS